MASIKKHTTQMTTKEKEFLINKAKSVKEWRMSSHLRYRMNERGGSKNKVLEVLEFGNLIEYHQKDGVSRFLMRGTKVYHDSVLCVVFQFKGNKVITLYWNNHEDHHSTLKKEFYDERVNILGLYKEENNK